LPAGVTETGTWAFNATTSDIEVKAPISFAVRLKNSLESEEVHFQDGLPPSEEFKANCAGGTVVVPKAAPGHLCVYFAGPGQPVNATLENITDPTHGEIGTGVAGALLNFSVTGAAHGFGTWAVTGS
jgi:hypothetical protein